MGRSHVVQFVLRAVQVDAVGVAGADEQIRGGAVQIDVFVEDYSVDEDVSEPPADLSAQVLIDIVRDPADVQTLRAQFCAV